ncbi:aconitase X [Paraburkholderia tagetis]|uniref:Aconitase X catalytic domain-containing protein n=1 Tax=Paraburkholderia tagetis TaxID=2913261 RepID=A0A9X1UKB4_9BURK|nr:aconitase X [Paraburkholderia tagetis]MCG5073241.1 aconitase X catalytic domain-containing protein [Paraburkholderia tagetis]
MTGTLRLSEEQEAMRAGAFGAAARWAIGQQIGVSAFFGATRLVPVASVHAGAEIGIMGEGGLALIEQMAEAGARVRVPATTAACSVDFCRWRDFCLPSAHVDMERALHDGLRTMGFVDSSTCINYQTVSPPRFREHLAWGDTGAVAFANGVAGARSNFEGGPASIAAALSGCTPEYGFHIEARRRATHVFEIEGTLRGISDWGALGALIGSELADYWKVPAIVTPDSSPCIDELKHLAASLASFGSTAMFHVIGATPEAATLDAACQGDVARTVRRTLTMQDIRAVYERYPEPGERVDLVVFSAPQLSLFEVKEIVDALGARHVARGTRLIITVNHQVRSELERLGMAQALHDAGAELLAGTCFYVMSPAQVRERFGFRTLVTPSAKLANIAGGFGYRPTLLDVASCVESAVAGELRHA